MNTRSNSKQAYVVSALALLAGCGQATQLYRGALLGDAVVEETGASRTDGANFGRIYSVTQIVSAPTGGLGWATSDLPFTGPPVGIGQPVTDGQTGFQFDFDYPLNNFQLADAHVVIDTQRDTSDTEAIFVDGVLSGRP